VFVEGAALTFTLDPKIGTGVRRSVERMSANRGCGAEQPGVETGVEESNRSCATIGNGSSKDVGCTGMGADQISAGEVTVTRTCADECDECEEHGLVCLKLQDASLITWRT